MRKLALLVLCSLLVLGQLLAQRTITGRVTDESGAALEGATVTVKGTRVAATTGPNGTFSLNLPQGARTLTVSYVGLQSQDVAIGANTTFAITLGKSTDPLDEVVVVGYTTRRKRDEAGAISTVRAAQIENMPNMSLDKALQGQAAGVLVQANNGIPGGAINVRIRGEGSINAGNQPLYIVDGVQMNVRTDGAFTQNNPLAFLNPDDIESIDILKDAASAAIYGSNAANGVVIVTTKKGRSGKTRFNVNTTFGQVTPMRKLDMVNSQEFFRLRAEAVGNPNNLPWDDVAVLRSALSAVGVTTPTTITQAEALALVNNLTTTDWQNEAFRPGQLRTIEVSASGGNDRTTFRISANNQYQETFVTKADFNRTGLKLDLSNKATDRLTISTSLNVSTFNQNNPFATDGSFLGSPAFSAPAIIPTNPVRNPDGTYFGVPGATPGALVGVLNQNIIAVNDWNQGFTRTNQLVGNLNLDYKLNSWLSWRTFGGIDYRLVQGKNVRDARTPDGFNRKGLVQVQSNWNTNINAFTTLNANKSFGNHNLDGLVGYEYRRENNESITATGDGFPTFQFVSLNNAANPVSIGEFFTGFRRNAVFGSVNYNFARRYLLGFSLRYDGSSRFGVNNQYGTFYGIKTAWNIDQEAFMKNVGWVSSLRLRFAYGTTGNDQIGNFDGRGLFGGGGVYNGAAGIAYSQLANPDLRWETNTTANVGLDFAFFKNRINGAIEVYDKQTTDLLLNQPLQFTTGFSSIASNVGRLQNRGVELTLNGDPVKARRAGGFNWNTSFNIGYNQQKVLELFGGLKQINDFAIQVGYPVGNLFATQYAGVNAATGRPMWYDTLGNITYQIQARDRRNVGPTRLPLYQGGFRNTFSYKGFSLDIFFQYEYGRWATDGQINFLTENLARINTLKAYYDQRWTTPGQITWVPRMNVNGAEAKGSAAASGDRTWFRADYIRLKNVMLAYDFNQDFLRRFKLNNARFYIQATNLWTYSDWFSYDIEFVGTATGIIPQPKIVSGGVQLGF